MSFFILVFSNDEGNLGYVLLRTKELLCGEMRKTEWFYRFTNLYASSAAGDHSAACWCGAWGEGFEGAGKEKGVK
jgi:hypothetical protein